MAELTHIDEKGNARMVDVSEKNITSRTAVGRGFITMSEECYDLVRNGGMTKGDVLGAARVAGIMGAKRTSELIPLCHLLLLTKCAVDFTLHDEACRIEVTCTVKCQGGTGVEMEALTGVSAALLTIYDMCKAVDREMVLSNIHLAEKIGGKSGHFVYRKTGQKSEG